MSSSTSATPYQADQQKSQIKEGHFTSPIKQIDPGWKIEAEERSNAEDGERSKTEAAKIQVAWTLQEMGLGGEVS